MAERVKLKKKRGTGEWKVRHEEGTDDGQMEKRNCKKREIQRKG